VDDRKREQIPDVETDLPKTDMALAQGSGSGNPAAIPLLECSGGKKWCSLATSPGFL
jgi:hypothetical protein